MFLALQTVFTQGIAAQSIVPDGRTATSVATQGAVTNVTTSTVRGANAFNSFSRFNVEQGATANLHLPSGSQNLVNLVRDARTDIHGVLNAIRDGKIDGNVWFANPHGFLVGKTGVVNVGSLNVTTPTQEFVDGFFLSPGNPDDGAVAHLLGGTAPRSGTGVISIQGTVNAADGIELSAGTIQVGGTLYSGARFVGTAPDFTDVVNANGLESGTHVVMKEGRIRIVADGDVAVSGTVAAIGGPGVNGGEIAVRAGGDVVLDPGATVAAHGDGEHSSGGTVDVWAEGDAVARAGALVDASAGTRGDGGAIEFSARRTVELAGGEFRADGTGGGKGGTVLIDPETIKVSAHHLRGTASYASGGGVTVSGADITLQADKSIEVDPGVVISSRAVADPGEVASHVNGDSTGSSGDITLEAPEIALGAGSMLLADVKGAGCVGCAAGDIRLEAATGHGDFDLADLQTRVAMSNAVLRGRDIVVKAQSTYNSLVLPVAVKTARASVDIDSSALQASNDVELSASVSVDAETPALLPFATVDATAEAAVTVRGNSSVTAGGSAALAAASSVKARAVADMPDVVALPADAGVAVVLANSKATVDVLDTSTLATGGALALGAANAVDVQATADASAGGASAAGGTAAVVVVDTTTRTAIAGNARVTQSGSITLAAESANAIVASAKAAAQGATDQGSEPGGTPKSETQQTLADYQGEASTADGGVQVAAAVAVSDLDATTQAYLASGAPITSSGPVSVTSAASNQSEVAADGSAAGGGVGVGVGVALNLARIINEAHVDQTVNTAGLTVGAVMAGGEANRFVTSAVSGAGASNVGVAGSLALNQVENRTRAYIAAGGIVNAGGGNVRLDAVNESESSAEATPADGGATGDTLGIGASVAVTVATNETRASLENGAALVGAGNVEVIASGAHAVEVRAEAGAEGGIGLTPVVAVAVVDNTTSALLGTGATLATTGNLSVLATHSGDTATSAAADAAGEKAAIGAGVAVTVVNDSALATTARDIDSGGAVVFAAHADAASEASAKASAKGGKEEKQDGSPDDTPEDGVDQEVAKQTTFGKSKQAAGSNNAGQQPGSAQTSEGKVSVAAAVAVNVAASKARAFIPDAREVDAAGPLTVEASNNTDAAAAADGSAAGSTATVGIGAAVAVNSATALTEAYIGAADVTANGLAVRAMMLDVGGDTTHTFAAGAKAGAGGGKVGIAGALALNLIDIDTTAEIRAGARIDAGGGDVTLVAHSESSTSASALPDGPASGGQVGVGASAALNLFTQDRTRARVQQGARLDHPGSITLDAFSVSDTAAEAEAGAAGSVAVDAVVAFTEVKQTTEAVIESGDAITAAGAVALTATAMGDHIATATGDVKSGKAGVGASAAVIESDTATRAALERDTTTGPGASHHLTVGASASRSYEAVAKASAGGGKDADSTTQAEKDKAKSTSTLADNQSAQRGTEKTGSGSKVNVAAAAGVLVIDDGVEATIGAGRTVSAGGNIAVSAFNGSDFSARGLGDAIDITKLTTGAQVGIGVGAGLAIVRNDTLAGIGDGAVVLDAGDIAVAAESQQNTSADFVNKLAAEGVSGAGSSKVSVAGALAVANSNSTTQAFIAEGVRIDQAGDVRIEADNTSKLSAKAWSAATSGKVGIGASVAIVVADNTYQAWLGENADVTADSFLAAARDHRIAAAAPFELTLSDISDLDKASSKLTESNLQVILGENNYYTEAIAGAGSNQVAVAGAFAVNVFEDTTEAWIGQGARLAATGAVGVTAAADATAMAFAGGVAASGKVGVGVATADIANEGATRAYLAQDAQVLQSGAVNVDASSALDLTVIGASAGGASTAGVSGVVSLVLSDNVVEAYAAERSKIDSSGAAAIGADNTIEVLNVAGVAGIGGTAGVGVSAGTSLIDNTTRAWLGQDAIIDAAGLTSVTAAAAEDVLSVVVGGAGGGTAGVAASAAVNVYNPVTQAWIDTGAQVNAGGALTAQAVSVSAESQTDLLSIVGTVGIGGTAGVGGAADVVVIDKTTQAWIAGAGSDVRAGGNMLVFADSFEKIRSVGVGFSAGGTAGVQGSASVVDLTTDTQAYAADGAKLHAQGSIVIDANGASGIDLLAGAIGAAGTAAVGAGAAVALIDKTTHAWIGDNAEVTALGLRPAVAAATGAFDIGYVASIAAPGEVEAPNITPSNGEDDLSGGSEALTKTRTAGRFTAGIQGLAVTATNRDSVESFAVTGAASGTVSVTLSGEVNVHTTDTQAWIGAGTKVNEVNGAAGAAQSVRVAAGNDSHHLGIAGALAASGTVGVGVGADVGVMEHTTQAFVGNGALVNAARDVEVAARSSQEVVSISASLGASGTVGVSGSVSVLDFDNQTWAWLGNGATIDAGGNAAVLSEDTTATTMIAGTVALGIGGGGVGGGVGITIVDKDTRAWIGDHAIVDARGQNTTDLVAYSGESFADTAGMRGLLVQADSREDLFTVSAAGAGGLYVGIAGAVSVASVDSDTSAWIGSGAQIDTGAGGAPHANQDVNVTARNDFALFNVSGALGVGAAGIAGAVDVGVIRNDTTAFVGDSVTLNAARDVDVNALARKDVETYVVSAAGGLAGIAAGVAVYSVGGGLDADSRKRLESDDGSDTADAYADAQATNGSVSDSFLSGYSDSRIQSTSARTRTARAGTSVSGTLAATETRTLPAGTAAFIGENATITAGRHVDLDARESMSFDMLTGALAVGAVGLGAGVGVANVQNDTQAFIDRGTSVTAGGTGNVTVTARLLGDLGALGIAGTGGVIAVDAAAAILKDASSVIARFDDGVAVKRAGLVRVEADDDRTLEAETYSVSVGAVTAGASVAQATVSGATGATMGSGVAIGQGADHVGGVAVSADANHRTIADATAGKAGYGLAASGTIATASVHAPVTASIAGGAITVQNDLDVDASATVRAEALAKGINVSAGVGVGASVATATATPVVDASIGSGTTVAADNVYVDAAQRVPAGAASARAHATGASGGLLLGANATSATARNFGEVRAVIRDNATLSVTGVTRVSADNASRQRSEAEGLSLGIVALGANLSRATSNTLTHASLGDGVRLTGGTLELTAAGTDDNFAYALAGSGGAVSGLASDASTSSTSLTTATTGAGSTARAIEVDALLLAAAHTALVNSQVDSTNASIVGASGAQARNAVAATTGASIGDGGYILADNIVVQAHNRAHKPWLTQSIPGLPGVPQWNVQSGSGGLFDLPAATSTTTIANDARVEVGSGAYVEQTGDRNAPGAFRLDAWNEVTARDKVKVDSGGAVALPAGESKVHADVNTATVRVMNGAEMTSVGDLNIGARSIADLYAQVAVDTYGVAGAPQGESVARFQALNRIEIGAAKLESLNDINLGAGRSSTGQLDNLAATARTDLYNNTAIPIDTDPAADAIIGTQSQIAIGTGADLGAVRHVTLFAEKSGASASGIGIGKNIYLEAASEVASAISNAFGGGDVSFETRSGRSIVSQGSDVEVNGAVKVGIHRKQALEIGIDGTVTSRTDGISITSTGFKDIAADILERIEALESLIRQYTVDNPNADASIAVAAYRSEIRFLERKLDELGFPRNPGQPGFSGVQSISPLQAAQEAVAGMTATVGEKTTSRSALTTQNTTLADQNSTLSAQNQTLSTVAIPGLQAQIAALDPDDDAAQILALQNQIAVHQQTIANNNTTITSNTSTIQANDAAIAILSGEIADLNVQVGGIQTDIDNGAYSATAAGGPVARFLTVSDVLARLGNIYVRGDRLRGSGSLDAPGDAEIRVTNNSPSFLVFGDLTIPPDAGGKLYFNNVDVKDNAGINGINGVSGGAAFTLRTADSAVDADGNPLQPPSPQILVTSNYDPLNPAHVAATPGGTPTLAPDIILRGDVSNLRGLVKIDSAAGSIRLEQKQDAFGNLIPGETATITAGTVEIATRNGDFVQSYTDAFYHTAGAPLFIEPGDGNLGFPGNIDEIKRSPETAGAGIVANGSVLIAARYLNINGVIQSGIPEWGVRIPAGATVTLPGGASASFAQAQAHYDGLSEVQKAVAGAEYYVVSGATVAGLSGSLQGGWEKVDVSYNAKENRLELSGVQVQGGYIELFGQIFNTNGAGGGKLRVLDGYGQIKVQNETALPLWVNLLDAGRGVKGEINITNITGLDASGAPLIATTTYTRDPGAARSGTFYEPTAGLRYVMTVGYDQVREDYYRYSQDGWFGTAILSGKVLDRYKINSITRSNDPLSQGEFLQVWPTPSQSSHYYPVVPATYVPNFGIVNGRQQTEQTSSTLTPGKSWRDCNWWTLCANAKHYQEFTVTTGTKTTITDSVRADYPIAIEYIGFDHSAVSVSSVGDLVLNGSINNRNGDTSVSTHGSIARAADTAIVGGANIALSAGSGIGSDRAKVQVNVNGGKLDVTSAGGEIHLQQMVGDLRIGAVGGANVANVVLETDRNLLGWDATSFVQGQRVELIANNGGIGELTAGSNVPFEVRTGYTANQAQWPNYGLMATARESINIRNVADSANPGVYSGNLLLIAAESAAGNVRIETSGQVIDNNPFAVTDERTVQDLANLWDALRLRGAGAAEKAADAIAAYERGKDSSYRLYWMIRERQADPAAYDAGFQYTVTATERTALADSGMSATEIAQFETNRTAQYHALHAEVGGFTGAFEVDFQYQASAEERASLTSGSSWSDAQLALSVGAGLLKEVTDTVVVIKEPNAKGRNVTLIAGQGIGSFDDPLQIDLSQGLGAITAEQKAALAAAERGDASVSGSIVTIVQPRSVNVETGALGALWANAGSGLAFIGSEGDLRIDQVQAAGDVRIKAAGSLVNAGSVPGAANVIGANLILESASGGIGGIPDVDSGFVATPLRITPTFGSGVTARAAADIHLHAGGDFAVDTLFSRHDVRLIAGGSIVSAFAGNELNVLGENVILTALGGPIGAALAPLNVGVDATGAITASAATFGQGIYLNGPAGSFFNIGSVTSGDAMHLTSDTDLTISGQVEGPGAIQLIAGGAVHMTANASVRSTTLGLLLDAASLVMADGSRLTIDVGTIDIETLGDAIVAGIFTGNPTESAIRITSGGRVLSGGTSFLDIVAEGGAGAKLTIDAAGGIGNDPLKIQVSRLDAATGGSVHIEEQSEVEIGTVRAGGEVRITAGGSIAGGEIESVMGQVALTSSAGDLDLGRVAASQDVGMIAAGNVTAGTTSSASGAVSMAAGGSISAARTSATNDVTLSAMVGDVSAGTTASSGGAVTLSAHRGIAATTVTAARDVTLTAASASTSAGSIESSGGSVTVTSQGSIAATALDAANDVTLSATSGGVSTNTITASGGAVSVRSHGGITAGSTSASRDVSFMAAAGGIGAGTTTSVDGAVVMAAAHGTLDATQTSADRDVTFDAAVVNAGTTTSIGGAIRMTSAGDIDAFQTRADRDVILGSSSGGVATGTAVSAGGSVTMTAAGDVEAFDTTAAQAIRMASASGSIRVGTAAADAVVLQAPNGVTVSDNTVHAGSNAQLAGASVSGNLVHTGGPHHLQGAITGFGGTLAQNVDLTVSSPYGVDFTSFHAHDATVSNPAGAYGARSNLIGNRFVFGNSAIRLLVDQNDRSLQTFDVQLYSGGTPFYLMVSGNRVRTDAHVIGRNAMFEVITPHGANKSALEHGYDALTKAARRDAFAADAPRAIDGGKLIVFTGTPVSLEGDPADGPPAPRCGIELRGDCRP